MSLSDISNILWRERQLLELLLFKLEEEQLILTTGRNKWLTHATREVEMVIEQLKEVELQRAIMVDTAAKEYGISSSPSLKALAAAVPAPWNKLMDEHRRAFLETTQEIESLAQTNREMLSQGHKAARDAMSWLGIEDDDTYGRDSKKKPAGSQGSPAKLINKAV